MSGLPWHENYDVPVPRDANPETVDAFAEALTEACRSAGVELLEIQSRAVFPEEFNDWVDECDSKGELLSLATLRLIADQMKLASDEPVLIQ